MLLHLAVKHGNRTHINHYFTYPGEKIPSLLLRGLKKNSRILKILIGLEKMSLTESVRLLNSQKTKFKLLLIGEEKVTPHQHDRGVTYNPKKPNENYL